MPLPCLHVSPAKVRGFFFSVTKGRRHGRRTPRLALDKLIADRNIDIAISDMTVGEKLRYLRTVEGTLRGHDREMTQQQVVESIEKELGLKISQSYLSQIERGQRRHLTNTSRMTLAK